MEFTIYDFRDEPRRHALSTSWATIAVYIIFDGSGDFNEATMTRTMSREDGSSIGVDVM
jgi:hypothetical protein